MLGKIHEYLTKNVEKYPDDCGIIYRVEEEYKEVTNKEILKYVKSLVAYMQGKYKKVAIIGGNKLEWLISFFAVFAYLGDVFAIDKELEKESVIKLFEQVKPDLVILDDDIALDFENVDVLKFSEINKIMNEEKEVILKEEHIGNLFLHTSGTTGFQKIVKLTEDNLFGVIPELNNRWKASHKDSCLFIIPMYHIYALTTMFHSLYAGVNIILENDYKRMGQVLQATKPTLFMGVPLMYNKIKEAMLSTNEKLIMRMIKISKRHLLYVIY